MFVVYTVVWEMHPEVYPFTKNLQEKLLFFNLKNFENPQMKSKHEINIENFMISL